MYHARQCARETTGLTTSAGADSARSGGRPSAAGNAAVTVRPSCGPLPAPAQPSNSAPAPARSPHAGRPAVLSRATPPHSPPNNASRSAACAASTRAIESRNATSSRMRRADGCAVAATGAGGGTNRGSAIGAVSQRSVHAAPVDASIAVCTRAGGSARVSGSRAPATAEKVITALRSPLGDVEITSVDTSDTHAGCAAFAVAPARTPTPASASAASNAARKTARASSSLLVAGREVV